MLQVKSLGKIKHHGCFLATCIEYEKMRHDAEKKRKNVKGTAGYRVDLKLKAAKAATLVGEAINEAYNSIGPPPNMIRGGWGRIGYLLR